VPHTGTHFAEALLNIADLTYDTIHWQPHSRPTGKYKKTITTVRNPYLAGIRWLSIGQQPERLADSWATCIKHLPALDHFILDIGCREADRFTHVCDAITFAGGDPELHKDALRQFADNWEPLNSSNTDNKLRYLADGALPNGYDWGKFNPIADWYSKLETNDHV